MQVGECVWWSASRLFTGEGLPSLAFVSHRDSRANKLKEKPFLLCVGCCVLFASRVCLDERAKRIRWSTHELEESLRRLDVALLHVLLRELVHVLDVVSVIDHDAAGVGQAPSAQIRAPVESPHHSAVSQMKVSCGANVRESEYSAASYGSKARCVQGSKGAR